MKAIPLRLIAALLIFVLTGAHAQQTVYLCNGTYTDRPCANGKEVDILPTERMHSLSGKKRQSQEAAIRDINRQMRAAQEEGFRRGAALARCSQLSQERIHMDRTEKVGTLSDRRLAIRQEQLRLGCKQN